MHKIPLPVSFSDARGEIIDLLENETINAVTVISFKPGAVRANHYHLHTTQWNYVISGHILLASQVPGQAVEKILMNPGDLVETPPEVRHALQGMDEAVLMVFTKGPRGGKEYETDTYRLQDPLI